MNRAQRQWIIRDLEKKMVFLVGPRQVGKTWLARNIAGEYNNTVYLNYDRFEDRQIINNEGWLSNTEFLILDELHKMPGWKNYIKGVFDTKPDNLKILVTGSSRLDVYRQTGDSLAGRFFVHHLLPFTLQEFQAISVNLNLEKLLIRGGFPEPFLAETDNDARRWRHLYADSLIRTDILDFQQIHSIRQIQLIFEMLRRCVGSPISYKSIAEDVQIAPNTVKKYIQILESLYIIFRIIPYSKNIARSLLKEPKIYFFDTGFVENGNGPRLENCIALSLLKHAYARTDQDGVNASIKYLRTKDGREVDFCYMENSTVKTILEVKMSDSKPSSSLRYFNKRYGYPANQLVYHLKREYRDGDISVLKAESFLAEMPF
jgi:predicted AAA+ superfamily ATPase